MPTLHAAPLPAVRAATRADYPAIRGILRAAYRPFAADIGPGLFDVYLADLLDLDAHARYGELLVSPAQGEVVGYAAFYPDASVQGLGWPSGWAGGRGMAVHPAHRGHGVARALLDAFIHRARSTGAPVFAFHTSEFMTRRWRSMSDDWATGARRSSTWTSARTTGSPARPRGERSPTSGA